MEERLFATNTEALPDLRTMKEARDPEARRALLEKVGMAGIAERDYRMSVAERYFGSMGNNRDLYRWFFQRSATAKAYDGLAPSDDALAIISDSLDKEIFTKVVYWMTESGDQVLAIGVIKLKGSEEHFLIAQWGNTEVTDIEQIRRLREDRDDREAQRKQQQRKEERRQQLLGGVWHWREPVIAAVALGITVDKVIINGGSLFWMIPAGVLTLIAWISIGNRASDLYFRRRKSGSVPVTVWSGFLIAASVLTLLVTGIVSIVQFEGATRQKDVLVCEIGRNLVDGSGAKGTDWWIQGPQGSFDLQAGMYGHTYYHNGEEAVKAFEVGKVYRLTYKGHMGPTYAVGATPVSTNLGQCGKH
jgi:hypothetical protein